MIARAPLFIPPSATRSGESGREKWREARPKPTLDDDERKVRYIAYVWALLEQKKVLKCQ